MAVAAAYHLRGGGICNHTRYYKAFPDACETTCLTIAGNLFKSLTFALPVTSMQRGNWQPLQLPPRPKHSAPFISVPINHESTFSVEDRTKVQMSNRQIYIMNNPRDIMSFGGELRQSSARAIDHGTRSSRLGKHTSVWNDFEIVKIHVSLTSHDDEVCWLIR